MKKYLSAISTFVIITLTFYYANNLIGASSENKDVFAMVYSGDSKNYKVTVRNVYTYDTVDLTGFIVKFRVKKNSTDTTYVIDKTCALLDAENGVATVALSTSDTDIDAGTYYAYIILTNEGDTIYETLLKSKWIVTQ